MIEEDAVLPLLAVNLDPFLGDLVSEGRRKVEGKSASIGRAGTGDISRVVRPSKVNVYFS